MICSKQQWNQIAKMRSSWY